MFPSQLSPLAAALIILTGALAVACDSGSPSGVAVPDRIEITAAHDTLTALGDVSQLTARGLDADGNVIQGLEFDWACLDCDVVSVAENGAATAVSNGSGRITARISGSANGPVGEAQLVVSQVAATVTVTPASPVLNTVGATQAFEAAAADANGNPLTEFTVLWISGDHRVATISPSGVATSTGAGAATITAAVHGMPGSATLTVDQAASQLAFITQPNDAMAGAAISPAIQVEIQDASGNRVTAAEFPVTLAIASGPGTLAGTQTVGAVNGVATFSGMWLDRVGDYELEATASGAVTATSSPFSISAGAPARLSFTTQPVDAEGNEPVVMQVTIIDDHGNVVPTATNAVSLRFDVNPGEADLLGTTSVAATAGVASFTVRIASPAEGYVLQARADGLDPAISNEFDVALTFVELASGRTHHSCGITAPGHAYCWGQNFAGQLGDGTTDASAVPVLVSGDHRFSAITTGDGFTCALRLDAAAYCWGNNGNGQLGTGNTQRSSLPVAVAGGHAFRAITAGSHHACALTTNDDAWCWGYNGQGQLGTNDVNQRLQPAEVTGTVTIFASLAAGGSHTCGISNARLYCWGRDSEGQVGNGDAAATNVLQPADVTPADVAFKTVASGLFHSCATTTETDGARARCWGYNAYGQIGNNSTTNATSPTLTQVANAGDDSYVVIQPGSYHTCAIRADNTTYCWGRNVEGQLGIGETGGQQNIREAITGGLGFTLLGTGHLHTCGIALNGDTYCWGEGSAGQLGTGEFVDVNTPTRIRQ